MSRSPQGLPCGSVGKESAYNAGDLGSIPGLGRSPGEGNGNPLQYSCLENPMGRGAWRAIVLGVTKSRTQLSDYHFTSLHFRSPYIGVTGVQIRIAVMAESFYAFLLIARTCQNF